MQTYRDPSYSQVPQGSNLVSKVLAVLLLVVSGVLVFVVVKHNGEEPGDRPAAQTETMTQPEKIAELSVTPPPIVPRGDLAEDEKSTVQLFQVVSPSVVNVTNIGLRQDMWNNNMSEVPQGTGTGFVWDTEGHIVTNYHVIKDADAAKVTLSDHTVWDAKLVGSAPNRDLVVLKIDAPKDKLHPIAVGTSKNLLVGQKVFAIGNPFGLDQTLTTGIISGLERRIQSITGRPIDGAIQTDAAINPGNSGGPLLDSAGRIIGVNTMIYSNSGQSAGVGFAVPVDIVSRIVPGLISRTPLVRAGLGVTTKPLPGIQGVVFVAVSPGSAAEKANLKPAVSYRDLGDVIVGIDGEPVKNMNDLYSILDKKNPGDTAVVDVVRGNQKRQVQLTLQAIPE